MKFCIILALIAFACAPAFSQDVHPEEIDCTEEFFRVSRRHEDCQNFFVCMIGGRVNFFCDEGYIFDEERFACRAGYPDTCEYAMEIEPLAA